MQTLKELTENFSQNGVVEWIGIRPERHVPLLGVNSVFIDEQGLEGDHYKSPSGKGKRAVTLIQSEHVPAIGSLIGQYDLHPKLLRRNLMVGGINLLALKDRNFSIGEVELIGTGICAPCSRMETILGKGGYNAMRGHGGITANVVKSGSISLGDTVIAK